jgi:hypothetical protein
MSSERVVSGRSSRRELANWCICELRHHLGEGQVLTGREYGLGFAWTAAGPVGVSSNVRSKSKLEIPPEVSED